MLLACAMFSRIKKDGVNNFIWKGKKSSIGLRFEVLPGRQNESGIPVEGDNENQKCRGLKYLVVERNISNFICRKQRGQDNVETLLLIMEGYVCTCICTCVTTCVWKQGWLSRLSL